jgi:uncharacterized damage-inducible protein DinB
MTDREAFNMTLGEEIARFQKVYAALPDDKLGYKHPDDPKGKTAGQLACNMACEATMFKTFLETGKIDMATIAWGSCGTKPEFIQKMTTSLTEAKQVAESMTEEQWNSQAQMVSGDRVDWESTRGQMAWGLLFDLIHHRGQLSTFIRPMGGKVPSIYGPSGDTEEIIA